MSTEKILLVNDDSDVRTVVRDALGESGYQIWKASDGPEALNIWKTKASQIDPLLADMAIPGGINGRQLADKLRREQPDLKVVFMSGHVPDMAGKGEFHGCFLQKPFSPERLAEIMRSHLDPAG
jgi:CheY-like chemotaxis protein